MLELRFSQTAGRAFAACDPASIKHLQILRSRFATATSVNAQEFELELDDLLVNLREIAVWPSSDPDVRWHPDLLKLVEGNAADALTVQSRLSSQERSSDFEVKALRGGWSANLTEFQIKNIAKLLQLVHGANFSVPGAGKTRVTLAIYQAKRDMGLVDRMLVVCPKAAFESWQVEADTCFSSSPLHVAIMDGARLPVADIVLVNYERLPDARSTIIQFLQAGRVLLVLDEAHRMKLGPAGAWGAACIALGPYAASRMILTGTPAPNGAKDLENLFAFLWPGQGRTAVVGALSGNDLRTASKLLMPLFVRTTKRELDLPEPELSIRRIQLPALHRELYDALLGQVATTVRSGQQNMEALGKVLLYLLMAATTPALLATGASRHEPLPYRIPPIQPPPGSTLSDLMRDLPQYELAPKYQETVTIVAENAANGRKTLIWSTFVRNLKSLEVLLSRFQPAIVHGGSEDRAEQLRRFRQDPDCLVLLSNPATLGEGISLHQVCHDAVYIDRDFAAGRFIQSLDRIHRLGLAKDVRTRITILVSENTIDELVEQRLGIKLRFMGGILDDPDILELDDLNEEPSVTAGMDSADINALIKYIGSNATP